MISFVDNVYRYGIPSQKIRIKIPQNTVFRFLELINELVIQTITQGNFLGDRS